MSGAEPSHRLRRSATNTSILGLASSVVVIIANLASGVITARALGPEGRAVVLTATVWMIVSSWVSMIGLRQSTQFKMAPEDSTTPSRVWAGSALGLATLLGLVGGTLSQAVVGLVISDPVLEGPTRVMLLVTVVVIWYEVVCGVVSGRHRVGTVILLRSAQAVLYVVLVLVALMVGGLTPVVTLAALAMSFFLPAAAGFVVVLRTGGVGRPDLAAARALLRWGVRIYPGSLATITNARVDLLVVPAVLSTLAVGYYGVASNTSNIMQQLLGNLALYLFPAMVASTAARRRDLLQRAVRLTLGLGLIGAAIGSLVAEPVIRLLYGPEFGPTVPLLRILLFAAVVYAVLGVLSSGLTSHSLPLRASVANLVGVPATVVGLVLLVPRLGAEGAAITSLAAYSLCALCALVLTPGDLLAPHELVSPQSWINDVRSLRAKLARRRATGPAQ